MLALSSTSFTILLQRHYIAVSTASPSDAVFLHYDDKKRAKPLQRASLQTTDLILRLSECFLESSMKPIM